MFFHEDQSWRERPARMSLVTLEAVARRLAEYCELAGHSVTVNLHGGEPLIVGVPHFTAVVETLRRLMGDSLARVSVQTNGALIDQRWADCLKKLDIPVGISLDGPARIHDRTRPDKRGRGSFDLVLAAIARLQAAGKNPGILSVISPDARGAEAYRFFRSLGILDIAFLLPDATHDTRPRLYAGLEKGTFACFLIEAFDAWVEEDDPEVSLRPLIGLVRAMMGGSQETDAFGSPPLNYAIVDTDGTVETIDTLRVCGPGVSLAGLNATTGRFDSLFDDPGFVGKLYREGAGTPEECGRCPEKKVCAGGYLPHRYSRERKFERKSVWCDEILPVLNHVRSYVASQMETARSSTGV